MQKCLYFSKVVRHLHWHMQQSDCYSFSEWLDLSVLVEAGLTFRERRKNSHASAEWLGGERKWDGNGAESARGRKRRERWGTNSFSYSCPVWSELQSKTPDWWSDAEPTGKREMVEQEQGACQKEGSSKWGPRGRTQRGGEGSDGGNNWPELRTRHQPDFEFLKGQFTANMCFLLPARTKIHVVLVWDSPLSTFSPV